MVAAVLDRAFIRYKAAKNQSSCFLKETFPNVTPGLRDGYDKPTITSKGYTDLTHFSRSIIVYLILVWVDMTFLA